MKNLELVEKHNSDGKKSYTLNINEDSDLSREEFMSTRTGFQFKLNQGNTGRRSKRWLPYPKVNASTLPNFVDWRLAGAVTPAKKQSGCK